MRIGVLTLPLHVNYGGILQAYALQKVLQDMGHDVVLLDSYPQCPKLHPFPIQQLFYLKRLIVNMFVPRKAIPLFFEKEEIPRFLKKENIRKFYYQHIRHVPFGAGVTLKPRDFDALVVGSDQVWRPTYSPESIFDRYLSFAKDWAHVKRIAYAASFGTEKWEYTEEQTATCRGLVQMFDAVSVREESGVTLCREHLDVDASWVLDPTLLVDTKYYTEHIEKATVDYPSSMCFSYILDSSVEKEVILQHISASKGYNIVSFQDVDNSNNSSAPTVEEWLKAFHDADFVFTDSFHGCVFSIIFNKPFVVYGNVNRGMARFHSLLSLFGLEERLVTNLEAATNVVCQSIDWDKVNSRLFKLRAQSQDFLIGVLSSSIGK